MQVKKPRRKVDPVGTRKAIVEAAIARFSENGYAGTSMAEVAKVAGITKSLVQYHFETKERLWHTVLITCMTPFLEAVDSFLAAEGAHGDVAQLIRRRYEVFRRRPEMVRLLGWAALQPSPLPEEAGDRAGRMWSKFASEQDPSARMNLLVGLAAIDGWVLLRRLYGTVMGKDFEGGDFDECILERIETDLLKREGKHETES